MSQTFIVTFDNKTSYEKYKQDVIAKGGSIKNDLGSTLLGFTVVIPPTLVQTIFSGNLKDSGISSFELDSKVKIQDEERAPLVCS